MVLIIFCIILAIIGLVSLPVINYFVIEYIALVWEAW